MTLRDDDFLFLLPKQGVLSFVRERRHRRRLELLIREVNAISRKRAVETGKRHLALFAFEGGSNLINILGYPEREAMDVIFAFMERKNLCRGSAIDVGANLGMHTIRFAKSFETVFAFEPHPITFELLRLNTSLYAPNAQIFKVGAGSASERATLYEHGFQNLGASSLIKIPGAHAQYEVQVERLDDIKPLHEKPIGLIKVDTEERELEVFQGAADLIRKNRPVLLFEDWKSKQGKASEAVEFLRSLGYSQFLVPENYPLRRGSRVRNLLNILRVGASRGLIPCDFSAVRGYDLIMAVPNAT